jgi:DNA (cytosine-5)-methyltransferase 1
MSSIFKKSKIKRGAREKQQTSAAKTKELTPFQKPRERSRPVKERGENGFTLGGIGQTSKSQNKDLGKGLKFVDLFCGIGGFHLAFHSLGAECVFSCDNNPLARKTYEANFKGLNQKIFEQGLFAESIENVNASELPDFDILCAGFPCQPFSQAGYKRGFADRGRGELFFEIARIVDNKRPFALFLENVAHLTKHDEGRTLATIRNTLTKDLGYSFALKIVKASEHGLPQLRPRAFMICFDLKRLGADAPEFVFPPCRKLELTMSNVWGAHCEREIGFTLRCGGRRSGIDNRWNWDAYKVNGEVRYLGPEQGKRMMGFPDTFQFPVSQGDAMRQLGNSVAVDAIRDVGKEVIKYMKGRNDQL